MKKIIFSLIAVALLFNGCNQKTNEATIEQWDVFEIALNGPADGNPYTDVELNAVFEWNDNKITVPGFYDGNGIYRIRFSPGTEGEWSYQTESNADTAFRQKGEIQLYSGHGRKSWTIENCKYILPGIY